MMPMKSRPSRNKQPPQPQKLLQVKIRKIYPDIEGWEEPEGGVKNGYSAFIRRTGPAIRTPPATRNAHAIAKEPSAGGELTSCKESATRTDESMPSGESTEAIESSDTDESTSSEEFDNTNEPSKRGEIEQPQESTKADEPPLTKPTVEIARAEAKRRCPDSRETESDDSFVKRPRLALSSFRERYSDLTKHIEKLIGTHEIFIQAIQKGFDSLDTLNRQLTKLHEADSAS